jgi:glycosyltransferase involved in cell wall biosynthesis
MRVCVVVPAFNEEVSVGAVVRSVPSFVDHIIVIDDASTDSTAQIVASCAKLDERVELVRHDRRSGVGAAIISGHERALQRGGDISVVMAGDGQMDPRHLPALLDKIQLGYDYAKGNRFLGQGHLSEMPRHRVLGNALLSIQSKLASGYWNIFDHDNGYTAIRCEMLKRLPLSRMSRDYNFERDMLVQLNILGARVADVPIESKYPDRYSKIRLYTFIPRASFFLIRRFFQRVFCKYLFNDVKPFGILFVPGFLLFLFGFLYSFGLFCLRYIDPRHASPSTGTVMIAVLPLYLGIQLLLFAFILDVMETPR